VAARRLVIVMLVLLAVSTLAATLLPAPSRRTAVPQAPTQRAGEGSSRGARGSKDGVLLVTSMRISNLQPKTVRVERGDQLRLRVAAPFGDDIEIPGLGLTSPASAFAPAHFDLLASEIGSFSVRGVDSRRLAGWILVGRPGTGRCGVFRSAAPRGRGSVRSCSRRGRHGSPSRGRSARRPSAAAGR
jgi:hypothetical protein